MRNWQKIKFSQEKVLLLHKLIVEQTGGSDGIRDFGLLDSALQSAYATFDGKELFPSKEEKAARIGVGLVSNHAFVDGNKRIGMYVLLTFLEVNGIPLTVTDEEVVDAGLRLAEGKMQYEELLAVGGLIIVTVFSKYVFKEDMRWWQWLGVIVGTIAVSILSI